MRAVGVQKRPRQIHDFLSSPFEHQTGFPGDYRHRHRLQIFLRGITEECIYVFRRYHHSHTLLRLGDRKLRPVQTRILFRHLVQIHNKPVRQLTDRHRHTARAEVVTFLDQTAHFLTSEQPLYFSLRGRVAFLHLRAARINGFLRVHLGGTCGAAAAVAPGSAAQKDNDIVRVGIFPDHIFSRRRTHHRADLHALRHIIRVINLFDQPGRQTDLVTVGRIPVGCAAHQLFLGQLSFQRIRHRHRRIRRAGHAHRLIDIPPAGKGIADRAAEARCRTAERLNLRGMVVGLILEKYKPLLRHGAIAVVHLHRHHHRAGVNLVGLLHIVQFSVLL